MLAEMTPKLRAIPEAVIIPVNPPSIPGWARTGGFEFWLQSTGDGTYQQLEARARPSSPRRGQRARSWAA